MVLSHNRNNTFGNAATYLKSSIKEQIKLRHKIISIITALMILLMSSPMVLAQTSEVAYVVSGAADNSQGTFNLNIGIRGVNALVGRLALTFDNEKLELVDSSSLSKAITKASGINLTTEGHDDSVLISQEDGYIMFGWYPSSTSINALEADKDIVHIEFKLKDGVSTEDFTKNTFGVRSISENEIDKWTCGVQIIGKGLINYTNISKTDEELCGVIFDYPKCDYTPPVTYTTTINVKTTLGVAISGASVNIDGIEESVVTDENGQAVFELESGKYDYRITADGFNTKTGAVTVNDADAFADASMMTYKEVAQEGLSTLSISFSEGDDANNVTSSIGLPTEAANGCTVSWISSNETVINSDGIVNCQETDMGVELTATVSYDGESIQSEPFYVTVLAKKVAQKTEKEIINADREALAIKYAPGDSDESVTADLNLPSIGVNGSSIWWESDNNTVINDYGVVTRPEIDTFVNLTAHILKGCEQTTKEFNVKVIAAEKKYTDKEAVEATYNSLEIGYNGEDNKDNVTQALILSSSGTDDVEIVWTSSHPAIVTGYGGVVRQGDDINVTLKAQIFRGDEIREKTFNITVKGTLSDEDRVNVDLDKVAITYAPGDTKDAVTAKLILPIVGDNGSAIIWNSSNPEVISTNGTVTRPSVSTKVDLTATASYGRVTKNKEFKGITVLANNVVSESDEDVVKKIIDSISIGYASGDNSSSVTSSLTLPKVGAYDTSILWESSNISVVSNSGVVTRKNLDTEVILKVTVTKNGVSLSKEFKVIVKKAKSSGSENGGGIENGGGSDNSDVSPTTKPTVPDTENESSMFKDLDSVKWAQEAINKMARKGIIHGVSNTEFAPLSNIKRGDFVVLLVRMLDLNGEITETFADVSSDKYYYEQISLAKSLGVVEGIGNNKFNPEGFISRQDMMTMTYRALVKLNKINEEIKSDLNEYKDIATISSYAIESIRVLAGNKFISGDEKGNINPLSLTTRAEATVFLYQIYKK